MTIRSEQGRYTGQTWSCYGVQPIDRGLGLLFQAWCYDGSRVHWLRAFETHSEAMSYARNFASS